MVCVNPIIPINSYLFSDDDNHIVLRALPTNSKHNKFINGGFVDVSPSGMVPQTLSSTIIQSLIYNNHNGRKEGM